MKIITRTLLGISLPALLLATGSSYATARLQSVDSAVQASGKSTLRLQFDSKVSVPQSFIMKQPASIVLDFPDAVRGMTKRSQKLNSKSVKALQETMEDLYETVFTSSLNDSTNIDSDK